MDRISTATKAVDLFGAGKHGFKDGDLGLGITPTDFDAEFFNGVQEELLAVIEGLGVAPDAAVRSQVLRAIKRIAGGNATTINSADSPFTLTADHAGLVVLDATAGHVSATLPAANVLSALRFTFVRIDATANAATINRAGADTIDGAASFTIGPSYDYRRITSGGGALWLTTGIRPSANLVPAGTPLMWPMPTAPSWALVRDGSAVSRAAYANLFAVLCPMRNMTTVNGTKNLTGISDTKDLYAGMPIEGAGIPAGATIETVTGLTTATMTLNATGSATVPVRLFYYGYGSGGSVATFGVPDDRGLFERGLDTSRSYDRSALTGSIVNATNTVTGLATTKGMYVGMPISAISGIPGGATVASITSSTAITMSANATATSAISIIFTGGQIGNERGDSMQGHLHEPTPGNNFWGNSGLTSSGAPVGGGFPVAVTTGAPTSDGSNGVPRTGPETRPKFRTLLPIIAH